MVGGLTALLLFFYFICEATSFLEKMERAAYLRDKENPDPLVAKIRMARLRAGLSPWPDDDEE